GDAYAEFVMQNIDAAPALVRGNYGGSERRFFRDVSLEGDAFAARLIDHRRRFFRRAKVTVDSHDLRTLLRKSQHRGAAITHTFAGTLPGTDDDGRFSFYTHGVC